MNNTKIIVGSILLFALVICIAIVVSRRDLTATSAVPEKTSASTTATTGGTAITGTMRDQIVTPIIANCAAKLKANPQTANLPVAYVSAWCSCNANELADHMTTQDVADLQSGTRSQADILTAKAEAAVIVCTQKVKLEVTGNTVK